MPAATREQLSDLHALVADCLLTHLRAQRKKRKAVAPEWLALARQFLQQNERALNVRDLPKDTPAKLAKLHGLLTEAMARAMDRPTPPASLIQEVRLWLAQQDGAVGVAPSPLGDLSALKLPFATTPQEEPQQ